MVEEKPANDKAFGFAAAELFGLRHTNVDRSRQKRKEWKEKSPSMLNETSAGNCTFF